MFAFYLVIGTLEDSGLLPRLAVLTDRGMSRIGLNGRAIVPMIVGVGCVTMAVIKTHMTGSRRERLIDQVLEPGVGKWAERLREFCGESSPLTYSSLVLRATFLRHRHSFDLATRINALY